MPFEVIKGHRVLNSVLVSMLDCQSRGWGSNQHHDRYILYNFSSTCDTDCTLSDEKATERTGCLSLYTEAKKMKSLAFYTQLPMASGCGGVMVFSVPCN